MSHISALGYLVVRGPLEPWRRFGTDVLGAQLVESPDSGRIRFRTDDRAWRIEEQGGAPGPDALVALGFEVRDEPALDSLAVDLGAAAVPVKEDRELAAARRVLRLLTFQDSDGNTIEAFVGAESTEAPFVSPRGVRFGCGDLGLGHAFMFSRNGSASAVFYQSVLCFRLSCTIAFGPENGYFLHCNPRHHSVAFAAVPGPPPGHVDLDRGVVHAWRSASKSGDTKTPKSRRSLELPKRAVAALTVHKARQAKERQEAGKPWHDNDLVFCHENGAPYTSDQLNWRFSKMTRRAGIGRWHAHEGRHTAASIMSSNGVPIQDISDTLGHKSTHVTETVYRHVIVPEIRGGATVMDGVFDDEKDDTDEGDEEAETS